MKNLRVKVAIAVVVVGVLGVGAVQAMAGGAGQHRSALTGFQEVPALSTPGTGHFTFFINEKTQEIKWTEEFSDLPTAVTQSHIHFENRTNSGGVVVFLCTNLGNAPAGVTVQACPAGGGTISGTLKAGDVIGGAAAQGISAGEIQEFIRAIKAGRTYANVHTTAFPAGEIRSQLSVFH